MRISDWSSDVCSSDLSAATASMPVHAPASMRWQRIWNSEERRGVARSEIRKVAVGFTAGRVGAGVAFGEEQRRLVVASGRKTLPVRSGSAGYPGIGAAPVAPHVVAVDSTNLVYDGATSAHPAGAIGGTE